MQTLRQALGAYTEEQLEQVAQWWGIGGTPDEGWRHHPGLLIQSMQDHIAARFAWEQLLEDERKVLHNALNFASSTGTLHDVLLKISRLPQTSFEKALFTLEQRLLLVEEKIALKTGRAVTSSPSPSTMERGLGGEASSQQKKPQPETTSRLFIPRELLDPLLIIDREIYTPQYDRSELKLEKILSLLSMDRIYEISRLYGFTLNDYYSRTLPSARLAGQLVQPEVPLYAWEHFDAKTRKLCKWLVDEGGIVTMRAARDYTGFDNPALAAAIHTLEQYSIAYDTFAGQERKLFVPRELLKNLKKVVAQTEALQEDMPVGLLALDSPPESIRQGDTTMLYDLATIIGTMYQQNIEPTQAGKVPKRIATRLQPMLQGKPRIQAYYNEDLTIDMLFHIAKELALVRLSRSSADGVKPRYEQGPQLEQWSQMGVVGQTHDLLELWLKSLRWADVAGVNFDGSSAYYLDIMAGRKAVLAHLSKCTPGCWYTIDSLLRTMKAQDPYMLRPRQANMGLSGYRSARATLTNWYKCDGEIIIGMLSSTLHELGIVALGYQQSSLPEKNQPINPDAFMLTNLATAVLSTGAKPSPPADVPSDNRTLIVQPNFELLLLQPDLPTLYSLLPFTQLDQAGLVSRLTLTRNSLLRGLGAGKNIEQIYQILEQRSQKEVPQNVAYTLRDWTRLYKEVNVSQVLLLEVPGETLANEICSSPKLKAFGLRRLAPCVIAVSSDASLQELRRALDKEGIVVRISGDIVARQPAYGRFH